MILKFGPRKLNYKRDYINPIRPGVYFERFRKLRFPKKFDNEKFF